MKPDVYISYAWGGRSEEIANEIEISLNNNNINLVRDKTDIGFKGLITDFMKNIGVGKAVIVIISKKYLTSPNCMFELLEIYRNLNFVERIFPIVLNDANIYEPLDRLKYLTYWKDKKVELEKAIDKTDYDALTVLGGEWDVYRKIINSFGEITNILSDINSLTPEMYKDGDFDILLTELKKLIGCTEEDKAEDIADLDSFPIYLRIHTLKNNKNNSNFLKHCSNDVITKYGAKFIGDSKDVIVGLSNEDIVLSAGLDLFEKFLYIDWKKNGYLFPLNIQLIFSPQRETIPPNDFDSSTNPISLLISSKLTKPFKGENSSNFELPINGFHIFNPTNIIGKRIRDDQYFIRDLSLRKFAFTWLLFDQLPLGSWGKSVLSWMNGIWKEMPSFSPNERISIEGGFETTILSLEILLDIFPDLSFLKSKVWKKSFGYLKDRFSAKKSGFGPLEASERGNILEINVSNRHTALTTLLLGKIISSPQCLTSTYNELFVAGIKRLFLNQVNDKALILDNRNPVLQYFLYWNIIDLLKLKKINNIVQSRLDIKLILGNWERSKQEFEDSVLISSYKGNIERNEKGEIINYINRDIDEMVFPYCGFIKMETYTFLTSAILLKENMSETIKSRYKAAIELLITDYLNSFGSPQQRYSHDPIITKSRGIKAHFSSELIDETKDSDQIDIGCTAMLYRLLRNEKIVTILWGENVPAWLDKIVFYFNEDLNDNFDRYSVQTELFELTNAAMLATCLIGDDLKLLNDEILVEQLKYLGADKNDISDILLDTHVNDIKNHKDRTAQLGTFSLNDLLINKCPTRYLKNYELKKWSEFQQIKLENNRHKLNTYLTSIAYSECVGEFKQAHLKSKNRKKLVQKIVSQMDGFLGNLSNRKILDAGCGQGDFAEKFANSGSIVTAIDVSEQMITEAKKRETENLHFRLMDIADVNKTWQSYFDGIVCVTVFQHISSEIAKEIIEGFYNALKSNGILRVDFQIGRERGFDPDLKFIESYSDIEDISAKLQFTQKGFEIIGRNLWHLPKGKNSFCRPVEFHFIEIWLRK